MNERLKRISQLIADMALGGATYDELERAIRHSLHIIQEEQMIRESELENGIDLLIDKYSVKKEAE